MKIEFLSKSANEAFARISIAAFASQLDPTIEEIADIKTSVSEAVTNAIIHAYPNKEGLVKMKAVLYENEIEIEVSDTGVGIENINEAKAPLFTTKGNLERSGMGFTIMENFMDNLKVESIVGLGTKITMSKKIKENKMENTYQEANNLCKKEIYLLLQKHSKVIRKNQHKFQKKTSGLIWSIVTRFFGRGYEADDLYQIACIGFIKAIKRFDFEFNVELSTYAVQYMIGEIKKFLRDDGIIRISRKDKELGNKIKELDRIYLAKTGESLCIKRLSQILELPEDEIYMAMEALKTVESINEKIDEEGNELIERIKSGDDEETKIVNKLTISELIEKLNYRDREIINLRYFYDKTQSQVASILGISQVHVSRLEKKILNEFRMMLLIQENEQK